MTSVWSIYLLRCRDQSLYCGITNDVPRRVKVHNTDEGAKYTKTRRPVVLVWSKIVGTQEDALALEYRVKRFTKVHKERLVAGEISV